MRNAIDFHAAQTPASLNSRWPSKAVTGFALLVMLIASSPTFAQLRIVTYNTGGGPRPDISTVLAGINNDEAAGITKPIDILLLQESSSAQTTAQAFADILNTLTSSSDYTIGVLNGGTSGGGRPTVVYNQTSVQLIDEISFGTVNTSAQARQSLRYQFRPIGYDHTADFYIYNDHYKAGDTSTDRTRRNVEATAIRANLDALGEGTHAILAGDFNVSSNLEPMWQTLRSSGAGQVFDPTGREGIWGNSIAFIDLHTQSPVTTSRYGGQTTGGMDDRFDFQVTTGEFLDNEGLSVIANTYRAFGNNGTHPLNGEIDAASNTAESSAILTALANSSDHLPVIVDYQLPAVVDLSVGSVPSQVIQGASLSLDVTVSNGANVSTVNGADELDFSVTSLGAASGSFAGTDDALGGGQTQAIAFDTSAVGVQVGIVQVTTTSQSAANNNAQEIVPVDVLAHANASFDGVNDVNSLTIDFGIVAKGTTGPTQTFSISNLLSSLGSTADLDLDQIIATGDFAEFTTDLMTLAGVSAGSSQSHSATLSTDSFGTFTATFDILNSDADLLGALDGTDLSLELLARIALGGDANLDGSVTLADVGALQIGFGEVGGWTAGNFNGDTVVSLADLSILQLNFGLSESSFAPTPSSSQFIESPTSTAVPEPGSLMFMVTAGIAVFAFARMQRTRSS